MVTNEWGCRPSVDISALSNERAGCMPEVIKYFITGDEVEKWLSTTECIWLSSCLTVSS
jgi:hypothetical protein